MNSEFKIDFVGIGAAKAGTTWLGRMLGEHPQLCMSEPKEVHYFNEKLLFRTAFRKPNFHKGLEWFKKYFRHCSIASIKGEITPRYIVDPIAAERIKQHNADIKIFICLRNPVDRIYSQYHFAKSFIGNENRSMEKAIREEPEYLDMSTYYKHIQTWLHHFPIDQFFFIWFEDIQQRPEELLRDIYAFLGVDPFFKPGNMYQKSNEARKSRFRGLQSVTRVFIYFMVSIGMSGVIRKLKEGGLRDFIHRANSKPVEKTPMPPDVKEYIIDHVSDDVQQLEKLLNKDLSHWLR